MKLQERQIQGFLAKPDPKVRAVLVYGPDGGLVRERAVLLCKTVVEDLSDPFRVAVLTGAVLDKDPARLSDEAGAIALTGGRRVVRLRDIGNKHTKLIESVLAENTSDTFLVAEADGLSPRDSLRAFFEKAGNAAALPCYADTGDNLERLVEASFREAKLSADPDAMAYLMDNLGSDRQITRRELEKLVLFKGDGGGTVTLEDARACVGDSSAMALDDVAFACAGGDLARLDHSLNRCFMAGEASVQVLRRVAQHFQRLHFAATQRDRGDNPETAVGRVRPPIHFSRKAAFTRQLRIWPTANVVAALDRLLTAEIDCKTTGMPDVAVCRRVLTSIAGAAARYRGSGGAR